MAEIDMGLELPEGKIARALRELNEREQTEDPPVMYKEAPLEPEEPCTITFQEIRCDTIADIRIYLFGMRDAIGNNPDNDYQQGQLNIIEKLLDATAG